MRVGIGQNTQEAKRLADEVSLAVIRYIKEKGIEDVAVVQSEFYGYSGDKPIIELAIPKMGQVVFGNMEPGEAVKLVEKYMVNTQEIAHFLVDNHGDRKKKH
ncbi:hypothetical protein PM10SUCC1_13500 [Propionigenium maris DSM 9537]|uniref:Uncharacterized protein n=1 Tax=Propionigenium maris DSM 9537 TaxID=1123000 RepID=A0A9W6GLB0_9FUSO|nr:hypothetical protein [Propionigenium maris]GLI55836.1 hypothetical protein PM10SUCC1_13500 [Propionigenium maris DSM 9537]